MPRPALLLPLLLLLAAWLPLSGADKKAVDAKAIAGTSWEVEITAANGGVVPDKFSFTATDLQTGTMGSMPVQIAGTAKRIDITGNLTTAAGDAVVIRAVASGNEISGFIERTPKAGGDKQRLDFKGTKAGAKKK